MLATSSDDGLSWSDLKLVIDPSCRASESGLWHDTQRRLWLMWNQYSTGDICKSNSAMWAIVTSNSGCENPAWQHPRRDEAFMTPGLEHYSGCNRRIARDESEDFLQWTEPTVIIQPDELDPPRLYNMDVTLYSRNTAGSSK